MLSKEKIEYFKNLLTERLDDFLAGGNKPVKDFSELNQNLPDRPKLQKTSF